MLSRFQGHLWEQVVSFGAHTCQATGDWSVLYDILEPLDKSLRWSISFLEVMMHRRPLGLIEPRFVLASPMDHYGTRNFWPRAQGAGGRGRGRALGRGRGRARGGRGRARGALVAAVPAGDLPAIMDDEAEAAASADEGPHAVEDAASASSLSADEAEAEDNNDDDNDSMGELFGGIEQSLEQMMDRLLFTSISD